MSGAAASDDREAALQRLRRLAAIMDSAFRIPGTDWRVGADALVGLVPGVGDSATGLVSLYIVAEARRLGVSRTTLARMLGNVAIDVAVGSIPLAGDVFDAGFKANRRNIALLEAALRAERTGSDEAS